MVSSRNTQHSEYFFFDIDQLFIHSFARFNFRSVHGNINEWNDKAAEITGYTWEEAVGRPLVKTFIASNFRKSVEEVVNYALQGVETR